LLNGQSAKGKTASGKTIIKSKYLASAEGLIRYKFVRDGSIYVVGNSSKIVGFDTRNKYNQTVSAINSLLKNKKLNSLVKTWLKKAKTAMAKVLKGNKSDDDKYVAITSASYSLQDIKKAKGSLLSVIKATTSKISSIFYSIRNVFKNNLTYKMYNKYGQKGINLISAISKKYNLSQKVVYNQFVNNKVTKAQMSDVADAILYDINSGFNIFASGWADEYKNIEKALKSIKNLLNK